VRRHSQIAAINQVLKGITIVENMDQRMGKLRGFILCKDFEPWHLF
jgi:hypothetical protein